MLTISRLLGHASFVTTMMYLHCRREHLHSAPSPLDWLPVQQLPTYTPPPGKRRKQRPAPQIHRSRNPSLRRGRKRVTRTLPRKCRARWPNFRSAAPICWAGESSAAKTVDEITSLYNSCGDRHCPQCSGSKRVDFNEKASQLFIDGVVYYQVVLTLPSELSELALANRQLCGIAAAVGLESSQNDRRREQGYRAAAISVLHTWNQQLAIHWHVHLLVPGEGPEIDKQAWKHSHTHRPRVTTRRILSGRCRSILRERIAPRFLRQT